MANTGPYDDGQRLNAPAGPPGGVSRADLARVLLWALLVISGVANMLASLAGAGTAVHLACGVVTALSAAGLAARALRARRGHR